MTMVSMIVLNTKREIKCIILIVSCLIKLIYIAYIYTLSMNIQITLHYK